ncbi:glycosyltransferase family 2 protein [Alteraurantiacibacter aestuarii]|nr:glycosyltransferase family 2 protein [Alteraurantiacibacter aestuarii]
MTEAGIDVSILIVGYNSLKHLEECLGSIPQAAASYSCEVLFVNNGTDNSEAFIARRFPDVRVLQSRGNVGFAQANNYLAAQARGQWLLLLNPDTRLCEGAIDTLLQTAERHSDYAVFGGMRLTDDGQPQTLTALEFPTIGSLWQGVIGRASSARMGMTKDEIAEVDAVSGEFLLVRSALWQQLGGMDNAFFLYAEEMDFCWRVKSGGGKVGFVPGSCIYHDVGSGESFSALRMVFQFTGNAHFYRKHYSGAYAFACLATLWLVALTRLAGGVLMSWRKPKYARMARGFRQVGLQPWIWMRGYVTSADPRRTSS